MQEYLFSGARNSFPALAKQEWDWFPFQIGTCIQRQRGEASNSEFIENAIGRRVYAICPKPPKALAEHYAQSLGSSSENLAGPDYRCRRGLDSGCGRVVRDTCGRRSPFHGVQ